jgi:hypothetical protein
MLAWEYLEAGAEEGGQAGARPPCNIYIYIYIFLGN